MPGKKRKLTLETYIATLSDEERRRHGDLIRECRHREAQIAHDTRSSLRSLAAITEMGLGFVKSLHSLEASSRNLLKKTTETYLSIADVSSMGKS